MLRFRFDRWQADCCKGLFLRMIFNFVEKSSVVSENIIKIYTVETILVVC